MCYDDSKVGFEHKVSIGGRNETIMVLASEEAKNGKKSLR
jgi:hypothetical protein